MSASPSVVSKPAAHESAGVPVWRATFSALCASLVGIGLARFAYTPLIPVLIQAGWFSPAQAAYLGAANFAGYLAGALAARFLARLLPPRALLRGMMVLASLAFFACSSPAWVPWFFVWRFLAGVAGGVLMILAAPSILPFVPVQRRGVTTGAIFTGIGLGIAASGTLIPLLLHAGVAGAWLGLGAISALLTALSWGGWPRAAAPLPPAHGAEGRAGFALVAVILAYGLNAIGLVPHMVFLVDYVARGLDRGMAAGATVWVAFGIGALVGPAAAGAVADRIGFAAALRLAFLMQGIAIALLLVSTAPPVLLLSAAIAGAFTPGAAALMLGRVNALTTPGSDAARAGWSWATTAWAVGQTAGAYAFSFAFARTGDYTPLFAAACALLVLALLVDFAATRGRGGG
jgi:predicted MFS family arabinose efflux permease